MNRILASTIASLLVLTSFTAPVRADEKTPAPAATSPFKKIVPAMELADGDSVVFLGDSITHQCLYTQYVEDYFYTRYPKMRLHFHNSGVGGDRAKDALTRFDEDVVPYKPKYVTILLGMNDGSYKGFDQAVFDTYRADMTTLLDRIAALGATAIPMTPTMHDARAARVKGGQEPRDTYYNGVLGLYGAWLREMAQVRGLGFVDMYSPLNNLTLGKRKTDPDWTMIKDAVHPGPVGQAVMAAAVISDMVKRSTVSQLVIDAVPGAPKSIGATAKIDELALAEGKLTFTALENALPWVLPPDAAEGVQLTALGHRYSNQKVTVLQLPKGKYALKIDGEEVGQFTDAQLARGVELQGNAKTPQYQQALAVALLNKQRNDEAYNPIRGQYAQLKGKRRDLQKATDANDPQLAEKKAAFTEWYERQKTTVADLLAKAKGFEDQIYQTNQPKPHTYEIAAVQ
jgi:lysophospholipase L1-like esterase